MFAVYEIRRRVSARDVRTMGIARMFVMCEQVSMSTPPRTSELASAAGISMSYASEIVNDQRQPSRPLAIHILRSTGWKHRSIEGLSDEQIAMLEEIEPWSKAAA
jgi:transcriptional regulator with XRE-family HTH domain